MKLRSKIILTTLSGGVLTLLSGLLITSFIGMVALRTEIGENFQGLAKEAAHKVDLTLSQEIIQLSNFLPLIQQDLRGISDRRDSVEIERGVAQWNRERQGKPVERPILSSPGSTLLRKLLRGEIARGKYASLFVVDRRGLLVASMNYAPDYFYGDAGWWKDALNPEGKNIIMGDVYHSGDRYVFDIVLPIVDEATVETIGAMKAVIDLKKSLEEPIHQIRFGGTGHAMLIDASGKVLICPILPTGSHITNASLIATVSSPEPGWLRADDDGHGGRDSIVGFAPVNKINMVITSGGSDKRWHTFIRQDPKETYQPIRLLQTTTSVAGVSLIGLLTGIAIYLANRLIRPIDLISEGAKRIGRGELHHRLSTPSRDEIGELALEFNKMADQVYESTALMERKIADRTNDLALVNQISLAANQSLDLQKTLKDALVLVVDRMAADAGHIGVCDREEKILGGETFSHEGWVGAPEDIIKSWNQKPHKTVQLDRPIVVDPKTPPPDGTVLPLLNSRYKGVIAVPIVVGDKFLGILSLARGRPTPFSPDTVDLLTAVAQPIGMAIQNAQLYEKSKEIDRLKSELITNVSHEIRTPMTSILGFAELLQSEDIDQTSRRRFLS
ncbi:MAG: cache domain-containing protein, partial [Nitrospiria bacterium]